MNTSIENIIRPYLHDPTSFTKQRVQSLWSGYGEIARYTFAKTNTSFIVKVINIVSQGENKQAQHPRGWHSDIAHQRKLSSYHNECRFYQKYAAQTNQQCAVPQLIASGNNSDTIWLIMEDLNARDLCERYLKADLELAKLGIHWLANFHACFMHKPLTDLWPIGTYWHLATRPHEWQTMVNSRLKSCATLIDQKLNNSQYKTLLHGDAKLANFCFHANNIDLAAVDFQYTGSGVGIKDLVYFLGSCFGEKDLALNADDLIDLYFRILEKALGEQSSHWQRENMSLIETEWRNLIPFAWADFERFLAGWAPNHKKLTGYSQQQTQLALTDIAKTLK